MHGELLSQSRFEEQLRRIGLIDEDQHSALNVVIRDPGVSLVAGQQPKIIRSQQPLTRMSSHALQLKRTMKREGQIYGHSNIEIDTKGYRDYRGVPVFGAWLWNVDLGLGLAAEIDVAEAMTGYSRIRRTVFGVLGFTLFVSVGAVLLVLTLGERTSRALRKSQDELELRLQERTAELRKLSQATENSPASVMITNKNGTIEYVNPRFSKWITPSKEKMMAPAPEADDASPEAFQPRPDGDDLPESLPGFDLVTGLERLRGNKRLYRKLLIDFGADYGGVVGEIREALEAKDYKKAHSLVHNLKGLAVNLAATNLQAAAVEMEELVRRHAPGKTIDKELERKSLELENAIKQALDAVQVLDPTDENKTMTSSIDARASAPPELMEKVTESILTAVELGDVMKIKSIAEELKSESDIMAPFCNEIVHLAENFDFDGIQKTLLKLGS